MGRTLFLAAIAASGVLSRHPVADGGRSEIDQAFGHSALHDSNTCTCENIRATVLGWCPRHSRGYAYGHVLRAWPLFEPLCPVDFPPDCTSGVAVEPPSASGTPAAPARSGGAAAGHPPGLDETRLRSPPAADSPGPVPMPNALLLCSVHSDHRVTAIPGYCSVCQRFHVNGHTYRSWVSAALEAGQRLPGLLDPKSSGAPTTQPAATDSPRVASPAARVPSRPDEAEPPQNHTPAAGAPSCTNGGHPATARDPLLPGCEDCKRAFAAGAVWTPDGFPPQPFCEKCSVGVVAARVFAGREPYELAKAADAALPYKRLSRCEICAVAILTGQHCNICKQCRNCHAP